MREFMEPSLSSLTTLRLGGRARVLIEPETVDDMARLGEKAATFGGELFFLGRGSNLLAREGELPLVLVSMRSWNKIEIVGRKEEKILARAEAGAPLARLLRFCLGHGLSGLEGLIGIPGSVGGACAMNAGSFGSETGAALEKLEVWFKGSVRTFSRGNFILGYRRLEIAKNADLPPICAAIFALTPRPKSVILQAMNLNFIKKKSGQPLGAWSAGCAFKNPPDAPSAGKLLERAGMRGKKLGGMVFSEKHANFLVNEGGGSSAAALDLLELAKERTAAESGVRLETEIRIIPWALP